MPDRLVCSQCRPKAIFSVATERVKVQSDPDETSIREPNLSFVRICIGSLALSSDRRAI